MKTTITFILLLSVTFLFGQEPFITTWQTDNTGASCSSCITIPTVGGGYNYEVDWDNDGVYDETGITGDVTHDFGVEGTYTIALRGDFPWIYFNGLRDHQKILSVNQWGDIEWESMENAFKGCMNLDGPIGDIPDLSKVTSLESMFDGALIFNQDIGLWDVSKITNMKNVFNEAKKFNQDISLWDVSNVTTMRGMFSVAKDFNQDIGSWDVSNVETMDGMFWLANSFNQDIGMWDVSNVTIMANMFSLTDSFNQDLNAWDVSNVFEMTAMFHQADSFNGNISNWDVSAVKGFRSMFSGADSFNQDLSAWDVSSSNSMQSMFENAVSFDQNLGSWSLFSLFEALGMFDNSGLSCENYGATLTGWANNPTTSIIVSLGAKDQPYGDEAIQARDLLISNGWTFNDDVYDPSCSTSSEESFTTTWQTDNTGASCSSCITIPTVGGGYNYEVDWDNDGVYDEMGITGDASHNFGTAGTYTITLRGDFPRIAFDNGGDRLKLLSVDQWGEIVWQSFSSAFAGCENMDVLATDVPDLSLVTFLSDAFSRCKALTKGLSDWDVSGVMSFSGMFSGCSVYNEDIGNWDVSAAVNLAFMFNNALDFNQDIGLWDVSAVTTTAGMFGAALDFNQDLNSWDVSSVNNMSSMFDGARVFNQPIGNWDVSNVTTLASMFGSVSQVVFPNPSAFNQDLSNWDVSNVTNMAEMFIGAESFNQDVSAWDVSNVTTMASMFREADTFNQDLSTWDMSNVENLQTMFSSADAFDQNLGSWDLSNLENCVRMLRNSGLSCKNYSNTLIGWASNPNTPNDVDLGANKMEYGSEAAAAREVLINKGWTISGDSQGSCTVATSEANSINITVYPNPVSDILFMDSEEAAFLSFNLSNHLGVVVKSAGDVQQLDLSDLPQGIYYLEVRNVSKKASTYLKLIKY